MAPEILFALTDILVESLDKKAHEGAARGRRQIHIGARGRKTPPRFVEGHRGLVSLWTGTAGTVYAFPDAQLEPLDAPWWRTVDGNLFVGDFPAS